MARAVGLYLTRFDEEVEIPSDNVRKSEDEGVRIAEPLQEQSISEEMRQSIYDEGRAAAAAEFQAVIERERAEFSERLQAERSAWANEEGSRLGEQFNKAIDELADSLASNLERILEPFVIQGVRKKMLSGLLAQLRSLLADRERPVIQLSGPMDLLEVVCAELNGADVATVVAEVGGVDVKARLDSTLIETSIEEWIARLRGGDDIT
jgi:hypothetical protein